MKRGVSTTIIWLAALGAAALAVFALGLLGPGGPS
jgi:hypothetical protein